MTPTAAAGLLPLLLLMAKDTDAAAAAAGCPARDEAAEMRDTKKFRLLKKTFFFLSDPA